MNIRLYVKSNNEPEALLVFEKVLKIFSSIMVSKEVLKIEPYWKIDGVYFVEVKIITKEITENKMEKILESISDRWIQFGSPPTEFLASDTTENCNYILDGLKMIDILFE